ncbi:AcrB/AcrD/AcrF family protein [Sphingomicrobium flavum]|uniref:AcrB/AcrD/AcrF family protein n=1 Tax=Sphingomicrobium flavum TaxID=1229164 RepID=UPI0021ADBEF1|nr:AcrB/AcrD/AcrF family protein [Sphingomicrobium flavum]
MGDDNQLTPQKVREIVRARWRLGVMLFWLGLALFMLVDRQGTIDSFFLRDTDDNLRLAQVRALLDGQGWYDLRQHRMLPPDGADIHWSRLVDLPIAGLILFFGLFVEQARAELWAIAIAPLLPMAVTLGALALIARRLVGLASWPLALGSFLFAGVALTMYHPLRIDHHGWQIAFLLTVAAGLVDPRRARGGLTAGLASAASLTIGLEMIIALALLGGAVVLGWVAIEEERRRMLAYAASLSAGTAAGFVMFGSFDNMALRCDALTPVWLADALLGSALLVALVFQGAASWQGRLSLAVMAGAILIGFHAFAFPHCLSRLEGVPPEVTAIWLDLVNEARGITKHSPRLQMRTLSIVVAGAIGYGVMAWKARGDAARLRMVLALAVPAWAGLGLLFWQLRAAPAAQVLAIPGAVGLIWLLLPTLSGSRNILARTVGVALLVVIGMGALPTILADYLPQNRVEKAAAAAPVKPGLNCVAGKALEPLNALPKGLIFAHIDLGPRLIVMTHHDAITGPYHRNHQAIGDVLTALGSVPSEAQPIIARYRPDYLLICDDAKAERRASSRRRLADGLTRGVPDWLEPVVLPDNSPFRLYRLRGSESSR